MVFHKSLSDSNAPQVSRTLLSIRVDLGNAVVSMVSSCPLIFKSSRPCTNSLVTVSSAPFTIDITVTFMFHSFFFSSLARSRYLSIFSLSFSFTLWSVKKAKSIRRFSFLLTVTRSGRLAVIKRSVSVSKSQRLCYVSFSHFLGRILGCAYHLFVWSNFTFLHNSQ